MSESYSDPLVHTRPFTVGVSIAAFLIFLIAIFHVWKYIFKKIKKWLSSTQPEVIEVTEIPATRIEDRKLSLACIQQLEMILKYEDEVSGVGNVYKQRPSYMRSNSEGSAIRKFERRKPLKRTRHSIAHAKHRRSISEQNDAATITFFAGYSHKHIAEI